jgi:hypothetical protein
VTGQRSNQLNCVPTRQINEMRNRQCLCGFARIAYRAPVARDCLKGRDFWLNRPQTAYKSWLHFAPQRCAKKLARSIPNDPSCHDFGSDHRQDLNKLLAQKYPNSFSQNAKERE